MGFKFYLADQIRCSATPTMVRIGADDLTVFAVCDGKLVRMRLDDHRSDEICTLPHSASDLSINVEHQLAAVAAGNSDVAIYDLETGGHVQSMSREGAPGSLRTAAANQIAIGSDGKMLVTTTSGSRIFVSNIKTGQWEHVMFVKYDGCDVVISPNGKYVALFGSPKASEISGHLTLYLVRRGLQPLWTRWHDSDNAITCCRFTPDSKSLITCGAGDGARVWAIGSGELQWHCEAPRNARLRAAWSFGAKDFLATLGDELMVVQKGNAVPTFRKRMDSPESEFAISRSGKLLIRAEEEGTLSVWKRIDSK